MTIGISTAPLRRRASGALNPATLTLHLWDDARDFVPAVFPAAASLPGRASLGPSGTRNILRKTTATRNIVAATVSGKPTVRAQGVSGSDHAAHHLASNSAPTVPLLLTDVFSVAGGSFSFVLASAAGIGTALGTAFQNPAPFGWCFSSPGTGKYATNLERTSNGYRLLTTRLSSVPDYYYATPIVTTGTGLVLVQGQIVEATREMRIRLGKGAWQSVTVPVDSGGATMIKAEPFLLGGIINEPGWGAPPDVYFAERMTTPDLWADATFNGLADRAVTEWGITP